MRKMFVVQCKVPPHPPTHPLIIVIIIIIIIIIMIIKRGRRYHVTLK